MEKDRSIPRHEYFKQLQLEFICAELRYKIYQQEKDKKYYLNLMKYKKKKIVDIAEQNGFPSIFSDRETKEVLYSEIYPDFGLPIFQYKNDVHRYNFRESDIMNYFSEGASVKIKREGNRTNDILLGKVIECNLLLEKVNVRVNGEELKVSMKKVRRIFEN